MAKRERPERPAPSRQSRAGLYAMCGLYLGYLLIQLLDPYFTPGAPRPVLHMLVLGVVVLGGGALALLFLAWRIYWTPAPQDPEEAALPEEAAAFFARVDSARMVWSGVVALEKDVAEMESRGALLIAAAHRLLPGASAPDAALAQVMDSVRRTLDSCRRADLAAAERARAAEAARQAEARKERCRGAVEDAAVSLAAAEAACAEARAAWAESMRELGLDAELSPATAREALECMDRVLAFAAERQRHSEELARQMRERDALLRPLRGLLELAGRVPVGGEIEPAGPAEPAEPDGPDWLALLEQVQRDYEANSRRYETKTALAARRVEQEGDLRQAEAVLADATRAHDWLLRMAEADDAEAFLRKHAVRLERDALVRRREDLEDALRLASEDMARLKGEISSGSAADFRHFLDGFAEAEEEEHSAALKSVNARLAVLAEEEARLDEAVRADGYRLAALASSDRLAALRLEEVSAVEAVRELALEWSRNALAKHLILEAKARFEQERQPEVIRMASSLFAEITGGRWQAISASLEDSSLNILPAHGPAVSPDVLSRGTREQLYLALRLAHIRSHAAHAAPLPVIMDDVLVNFDPERAESTARALGSLCEAVEGKPAQQVLFFTCHPHTAHRLRELVPGSALYGMEKGEIQEIR